MYITKTLDAGSIRFQIDPGSPPAPAPRNVLSTRSDGTLERRETDRLLSEERHTGNDLHVPVADSGSPVSSPRGFRIIAFSAAVVGPLVILLGLAVMVTKGAQGILEVVLGAAVIAAPLVVSARKRRQERARIERARAADEAEERRRRDIIGSFSERLRRLGDEHDESTLETIRREREEREIPYEIMGPPARNAVLQVGFRELQHLDTISPLELAGAIERSAEAVGLTPNDREEVKRLFHQRLTWHLVADDRVDEDAYSILQAIRQALALEEGATAADVRALDQLRRLRSIRDLLPTCEPFIPLARSERCHHITRGSLLPEPVAKRRWIPVRVDSEAVALGCDIHITSEGIVLRCEKHSAIPYRELDELEIDADHEELTIRTRDRDEPIRCSIPDPIYSAGIIELAAANKPRATHLD